MANCGGTVEGSFLHKLVLTDVASSWAECLARLHRSQSAAVQALDRAQQLLPMLRLGLDTANGNEFTPALALSRRDKCGASVKSELLAYCERTHLTFTRGRANRKNDQC